MAGGFFLFLKEQVKDNSIQKKTATSPVLGRVDLL
jgi:hypothetical protein